MLEDANVRYGMLCHDNVAREGYAPLERAEAAAARRRRLIVDEINEPEGEWHEIDDGQTAQFQADVLAVGAEVQP